jgi:DHA1 family chloramphenicol resistance protein-like MFS transporter
VPALAAAVQGALSFGAGSALVTRVPRLASGALSPGGAFATVALNAGAVLGAAVAGAVTEATGDHRHAVWVSVAGAVAAPVVTACAPRSPRCTGPRR